MNRFRFVHLNVHSHYSINDGCASIKELVDAAIKDKMPGIAITDNGNMFGVMEFSDYVSRINNKRRQKGKKPFKPIMELSSFGFIRFVYHSVKYFSISEYVLVLCLHGSRIYLCSCCKNSDYDYLEEP